MRGFGVVFTPPVAYKGIASACRRNTLTMGLKEKRYRSLYHDACHHEDCCHPEEEELADGFEVLGRHAPSLHRAQRMVDLVAVELAHWDEV